MGLKYSNSINCRKLLQLSLNVDTMIRFAELANPEYNLYQRLGIKEGMPISNQLAAERIVADMIREGHYVDFVEILVKVDTEGYMGTSYNLQGMKNVVDSLTDEGFVFDKVTGQFFENQKERISPNWGRLLEGDERKMTMLRMDIAGNSTLVRTNPPVLVEKAYRDIRNIMNHAVISRFGRLWVWEGDGAHAAFLFGPMEKMAVFAGMEILHEVFFYNRLRNPLNSPINIRLGVQIGQVRYSEDKIKRLKNETVKQATLLEALAPPNSLCASFNLCINMDRNTLDLFSGEKNNGGCKYRFYTMGLEK